MKKNTPLYLECKVHGTGDAQVILSDAELYALCLIAQRDMGIKELVDPTPAFKKHSKTDYFHIPVDWFEGLPEINKEDVENAVFAFDKNSRHRSFLKVLCELHRRRRKYRNILTKQPFPTAEQIGPRALLEFGSCDETHLFNWMFWRKWIYDIDNRSAQETGYLFEPLLAQCIGGYPISSRNSPVKRISDAGTQTNDGRQIDCYVEIDGKKFAYELKLRVTIAASGQGRFNEEMTFPQECRAAGIIPVLIVLDATGSTLLKKLEKQYHDNDGLVFIGPRAWERLEKDAGKILGIAIEKYIKPPISKIDAIKFDTPTEITLSATENAINISSKFGDLNIKRIEKSK